MPCLTRRARTTGRGKLLLAATLCFMVVTGCTQASPAPAAAGVDAAFDAAVGPDGPGDLDAPQQGDASVQTAAAPGPETTVDDLDAPLLALDLSTLLPDLKTELASPVDGAMPPDLLDAQPDLDAGGDICKPTTFDGWDQYWNHPNCAVGCSCFGAANECPSVNSCCGYQYGGCFCNQFGKIACVGGGSEVCDACMFKPDASSDTFTGPGAPCKPGLSPPSCLWGFQALACEGVGASGKVVVTATCGNGTECVNGACKSTAGTKGVACEAGGCAKLAPNGSCVTSPSGAGVCGFACGVCSSTKCYEYPQAGLAGHMCVGPFAQGGSQAWNLANCDKDVDCAAGLACKAFPIALPIGAKYVPAPVAKVCVPAGW